jgi:DNA-binding transcriptional ArsR family regulator
VTPPSQHRIWLADDQLRAGYTQCLNVLLPARALGASDKVVFFGVLSFAWQDAAAWPSIETLSARVGLSRATVLRSLAELKRVGLLRVRRRGQGLVNLYEIPRITQLLLERIGALEPSQPDPEPAADEDLVEVEDLTEAKGFTPLSNLILTARGLDASDKLVYVGLRSFAWGRGRCRLKMRTLARRIGMSERSVETHLGRLRAAGLVTRRRRGLGRANVYTLVHIHAGVLIAIQAPRRAVPSAVVDNSFDVVLARCPVCRARLPEPAPALLAILKCQRCRSAAAAAGEDTPLNGKGETSGSEVAALPFRDGRAGATGDRSGAVPEIAALPDHEEDPSEEDSGKEGTGSSLGNVDGGASRTWRSALRELRGALSTAAFETWFRSSAGLAWEGEVFTVGVPHPFAREWIDVRFRGPAEAALARAAGRQLRLVVEVMGPAAGPPPV